MLDYIVRYCHGENRSDCQTSAIHSSKIWLGLYVQTFDWWRGRTWKWRDLWSIKDRSKYKSCSSIVCWWMNRFNFVFVGYCRRNRIATRSRNSWTSQTIRHFHRRKSNGSVLFDSLLLINLTICFFSTRHTKNKLLKNKKSNHLWCQWMLELQMSLHCIHLHLRLYSKKVTCCIICFFHQGPSPKRNNTSFDIRTFSWISQFTYFHHINNRNRKKGEKTKRTTT